LFNDKDQQLAKATKTMENETEKCIQREENNKTLEHEKQLLEIKIHMMQEKYEQEYNGNTFTLKNTFANNNI
jgi:hypothetical protein